MVYVAQEAPAIRLVMDAVQILAWIGAIVFGAITASKAIEQSKENREQRQAELKWRKANAAKDLLDDIHHHPLAIHGVHMLDWCDGEGMYEISKDVTATITYEQVIAALKLTQSECAHPRDIFIRDCLDWFFFFVARIEQSIRSELIEFADVEDIFRPYARILLKHKAEYVSFWTVHDYDLTGAFFHRYPVFNQSKSEAREQAAGI